MSPAEKKILAVLIRTGEDKKIIKELLEYLERRRGNAGTVQAT